MSQPVEQDLEAARAVPDPSFRGALGRRLTATPPGASRPARLWMVIGLLAGLGGLLLLIAALQI